ncbi:Hypothetical predicted protein [Mytilus galloprovincialis]|uniref:Uncharacterized protein n=1 Tax=Mytilus galloprovincialis TaxID=29158 RepID=A0A8B6EH19_MYTGA|nr:Hypothetical predicted protein [Mytilus galloprovincialis]
MEIYVLVLSLATLGGQAYSCCMPQQLEGTVGMSIALSNNGNPLQITAVYDKWAMDTAIGKGYLSGTVYVGGHAIHQEIVQDFNNNGKCAPLRIYSIEKDIYYILRSSLRFLGFPNS